MRRNIVRTVTFIFHLHRANRYRGCSQTRILVLSNTTPQPLSHHVTTDLTATWQPTKGNLMKALRAIIRPSGSCKYHNEMFCFPTNLSFLFALHYWLVRASILCNITLFVHALSTEAIIADNNRT